MAACDAALLLLPLLSGSCADPKLGIRLAPNRACVQYWKSMRARSADLGGIDDTGCAFLQTAAEAIDAPDNSFDVVYR